MRISKFIQTVAAILSSLTAVAQAPASPFLAGVNSPFALAKLDSLVTFLRRE